MRTRRKARRTDIIGPIASLLLGVLIGYELQRAMRQAPRYPPPENKPPPKDITAEAVVRDVEDAQPLALEDQRQRPQRDI